MGCGASTGKGSEKSSSPDGTPQPPKRKLREFYIQFRCQSLQAILTACTQTGQENAERYLRYPVPSSRRGSVIGAETEELLDITMQNLAMPNSYILEKRLTHTFYESDDVTPYDLQPPPRLQLENVKIIEYDLPIYRKPADTMDSTSTVIQVVGASPRKGAPIIYNFDDDNELSEQELFEKMLFQPATASKSPSSIASSRKARSNQYSPSKPAAHTDDIDEAVGYANAGFVTKEPPKERILERIQKGATKALLNGVTDFVEDCVILQYEKKETLEEFQSAKYEPPESDCEVDDMYVEDFPSENPSSIPVPYLLLVGPAASHYRSIFHFVVELGEAADLIPNVPPFWNDVCTSELTAGVACVDIQNLPAQQHTAYSLCSFQESSIIKKLSFCGDIAMDSENAKKELLMSASVDVSCPPSKTSLAKRWGTHLLPWLVEQYRVNHIPKALPEHGSLIEIAEKSTNESLQSLPNSSQGISVATNE